MDTFKYANGWFQAQPITLTDTQRRDYKSGIVSPEVQSILDKQWKAVDPSIAITLNAALDAIKPVIGNDDSFVIVSSVIDSKDNVLKGILNYTLNGDYNQVRF